MAVSVVHATVATLPDEPGAEINKAEWNEAHTVTGLGTMAEEDAADYLAKADNLSGLASASDARTNLGLGTIATAAAADYTTTAGLTAYLASPPAIGGTAAAAVTGTTITANTKFVAPDGAVGTPGITGSDADSGLYWASSGVQTGIAVNGVAKLITTTAGVQTGGVLTLAISSAASGVAAIEGTGSNTIRFSQNGTVTTNSRTEINKTVTGITDAAATATFTVTIPNAAHTATVEFELTGIIGAGGAIGAHEAAATTSGKIIVTRTAGVNAVASAVSTAFGAVAANVAGATTVTVAAAVSAISGAVGATNTFTINVTITKAGGSSANHICLCYAKVMNANASGVTIS
jgi:hypothetical protein